MTGEGSDDCVVQALDVLDDVFYVYDRDARLVEWNRRLEDVFGLTAEELDGMAATAFFVPEDRPAVERAVDLAERYDATVHALYVVDSSAYGTLDTSTSVVVDALEETGLAPERLDLHEATRELARRLQATERYVDEIVGVVDGLRREEDGDLTVDLLLRLGEAQGSAPRSGRRAQSRR